MRPRILPGIALLLLASACMPPAVAAPTLVPLHAGSSIRCLRALPDGKGAVALDGQDLVWFHREGPGFEVQVEAGAGRDVVDLAVLVDGSLFRLDAEGRVDEFRGGAWRHVEIRSPGLKGRLAEEPVLGIFGRNALLVQTRSGALLMHDPRSLGAKALEEPRGSVLVAKRPGRIVDADFTVDRALGDIPECHVFVTLETGELVSFTNTPDGYQTGWSFVTVGSQESREGFRRVTADARQALVLTGRGRLQEFQHQDRRHQGGEGFELAAGPEIRLEQGPASSTSHVFLPSHPEAGDTVLAAVGSRVVALAKPRKLSSSAASWRTAASFDLGARITELVALRGARFERDAGEALVGLEDGRVLLFQPGSDLWTSVTPDFQAVNAQQQQQEDEEERARHAEAEARRLRGPSPDEVCQERIDQARLDYLQDHTDEYEDGQVGFTTMLGLRKTPAAKRAMEVARQVIRECPGTAAALDAEALLMEAATTP